MEKDTLTNSERERERWFKENNSKGVELNQLRQISQRQEANKYPEIGKLGNSYCSCSCKIFSKILYVLF